MNTTNGSRSSGRLTRSEPSGSLNVYLESPTERPVAKTLGPRPPYQAETATAAIKNRKTGDGHALLSAYVMAKATNVATMASAYREAGNKT